MSSVDTGANSIATVLAVELRDTAAPGDQRPTGVAAVGHVRQAMWLTVLAGALITGGAFALTLLPAKWGIVSGIARTFNAVTGPLGGLFLIGLLLPFVGGRAAAVATCLGLVTSVWLGYLEQWSHWLVSWGLLSQPWPELSFTSILPASLAVTMLAAIVLAPLDRRRQAHINGRKSAPSQ
jgi:hypothetical protein